MEWALKKAGVEGTSTSQREYTRQQLFKVSCAEFSNWNVKKHDWSSAYGRTVQPNCVAPLATNRDLLKKDRSLTPHPTPNFRKHSFSATYYRYAWTAAATNTVEVPAGGGAAFAGARFPGDEEENKDVIHVFLKTDFSPPKQLQNSPLHPTVRWDNVFMAIILIWPTEHHLGMMLMYDLIWGWWHGGSMHPSAMTHDSSNPRTRIQHRFHSKQVSGLDERPCQKAKSYSIYILFLFQYLASSNINKITSPSLISG